MSGLISTMIPSRKGATRVGLETGSESRIWNAGGIRAGTQMITTDKKDTEIMA
jgi:hypothetical protein